MHGSATKFGKTSVDQLSFIQGVPVAIVLGIIGGAAGALFLEVNFKINEIRKSMLTKQWHKPLETAMMVFISASVFFMVPYLMMKANKNNCYKPEIEFDPHIHY